MATVVKEIKVVHVADLDSLLEAHNQLQDFVNGNIKCQICSNKITRKNAGGVKRVNGKLSFVCNTTSCYRKILKSD